jgi:hypothetical protein
MHQYALLGKGSSIHWPCQLESYHNDVNDKSIRVTGDLHQIKTLDGYIIPLVMQSGLACLPIGPYTDAEWDTLPHVFLTAEQEWDPSVIDHEYNIDDVPDVQEPNTPLDIFDDYGNYRYRIMVQNATSFHRIGQSETMDDVVDRFIYHTHIHDLSDDLIFYNTHQQEPEEWEDVLQSPSIVSKTITKHDPDYHMLLPLFGWIAPDIIKHTFEHTTQYARIPTGTLLKQTFKSPNSALHVTRRNEAVACDIVYSDTPAINDDSTAAVLFVGLDTQVTDVYGIKTDKQFVNTLEEWCSQQTCQ